MLASISLSSLERRQSHEGMDRSSPLRKPFMRSMLMPSHTHRWPACMRTCVRCLSTPIKARWERQRNRPLSGWSHLGCYHQLVSCWVRSGMPHTVAIRLRHHSSVVLLVTTLRALLQLGTLSPPARTPAPAQTSWVCCLRSAVRANAVRANAVELAECAECCRPHGLQPRAGLEDTFAA